MHATATPADRTGAPAILKPLPDQPGSWIAHEKPIPFDQAAEKILWPIAKMAPGMTIWSTT